MVFDSTQFSLGVALKNMAKIEFFNNTEEHENVYNLSWENE